MRILVCLSLIALVACSDQSSSTEESKNVPTASEIESAERFQQECLTYTHCAEAVQTESELKSKYNLCYNDRVGHFESCDSSPVELIEQAEMLAEACAKYGPDDPNDDSCAREKEAEYKLKREFHLCVSEKDNYEFRKCEL